MMHAASGRASAVPRAGEPELFATRAPACGKRKAKGSMPDGRLLAQFPVNNVQQPPDRDDKANYDGDRDPMENFHTFHPFSI
jgi:hypothetical protein